MQQFGELTLFGRELWWSWRRVLLAQGLPGPWALQQWLSFTGVIFVTHPSQVSHRGGIKNCLCEWVHSHLKCLYSASHALQTNSAHVWTGYKKKAGLSFAMWRKGSFKSLSDDYQERWSGLNIHLLSGLGLLGQFILLPTLIELFSFSSYSLALKIWTKVARNCIHFKYWSACRPLKETGFCE